MKVFIPHTYLTHLKLGMELKGIIRVAEELAYILPEKTGVDGSPIGSVVPASEIQSAPPRRPWLSLSMTPKGPIVHAWLDDVPLLAQVEMVREDAVYSRTPFDSDCLTLLHNSRVTIFGCGTGGSYMALELARAGVRQFNLVDPDSMEVPNLSRHEGGFTDLGRPKVRVVKDRILLMNPNASVNGFAQDLFFDDPENILPDLYRQSDLILAATDRLAIQLLINEFAFEQQVPTVFGGCYENAIGGEVFAYVPEWKTPCYCCLKGGGVTVDQEFGPMDYSTATGPEDYEGQPGLHSAVNFISSLETQIAIGVLLRRHTESFRSIVNPDQCFWFIGGAFGSFISPFRKPFDIFPVRFEGPRSTCEVCQRNPSLMVLDEGLMCEEIDDKDTSHFLAQLTPYQIS